jgi:hypothetical protein
MSGVARRDTAQDELSTDGRWMTYGELATIRGIDRQSAVKLVRRQRWRRQEGNNGVTRVFVPSDQLTRARYRDEGRAEAADEPGDEAQDTAAFETALATIRAAHASEISVLRDARDAAELSRHSAQALAERAIAMLADATTLADRADERASRAEARAEELRTTVDDLKIDQEISARELEAVRGEAEALRQADEARKTRGLVARLRAAWRSE